MGHTETGHALMPDPMSCPGRPERVSQVMAYHPQYLDIFLRTHNFILRGDGPLPFPYRHYIAMMAAGRHQCTYLMEQQSQEFLAQGGDEEWLKGLDRIPNKLRDLYEVNKILAHRPWLINKKQIERLTKGSDSWSLGELVHALVLLAHFHALSSFVFGCGIGDGEAEPPKDPDTPIKASPDGTSPPRNGSSTPRNGSSSPRNVVYAKGVTSVNGSPKSPARSVSSSPTGSDAEVGVDTLMQRMKTLSERQEECTPEEQNKRYENVESQNAELAVVSSTSSRPQISHWTSLIQDPGFQYQDFARRGEVSDIPTFRIQDYSWDDHAFSLVNRLYNDVGYLLDDKFRLTYHLTYYTMGSRRDVDTSRFRRAIWNYIQCMFGIRHDDYDYGEVNQLLERSLKAYIKSVVCYPERATRKDYDSVLKEFRHSEKIHVNLMMLEARMQAELLYSLRAVMKHMT